MGIVTTENDLYTVLLELSLLDGNTLLINSIIKQARAAITDNSGGVTSLVSTGLNGKSFTKQIHLTQIQVLRAAISAKKAIEAGVDNAEGIRSTIPDFRCIIM